jgi:hypothetical protein
VNVQRKELQKIVYIVGERHLKKKEISKDNYEEGFGSLLNKKNWRYSMNIIEVTKKENVGKSYKITIDGKGKGTWELKETYGSKDLEFYKDKLILTEAYFSSQLIRMEFEEVINWSKVPVDTPIWVRDDEEVDWLPRHFAKYENGKFLAWDSGKTSFTVTSKYEATSWKYAKLYQK